MRFIDSKIRSISGFRSSCLAIFVLFSGLSLLGQSLDNAVKIIETDSGRGSGFLIKEGEQTYLMSNAHVLAGCKTFKALGMQGGELALSQYIEVAGDGRDLVRIPVKETTGLRPAPTIKIGEQILVMGNSGGARMVTQSRGEVLAVGPDRVEVSAAFIQGNSGGPVLNSKNEVVGVATYVFRDAVPGWVAQNTRYARTRRVAMRVNEINWQVFNWYAFQREGNAVSKHKQGFEQSIERLNNAFQTRNLETVLNEKKEIRRNISSFNRDIRAMRIPYFREDLKEISEGWEDVAKFLNENFPDSPRITSNIGGSSYARSSNQAKWPKVDVDRAASYLKEKAKREAEAATALDDRIRQGLETGLVNGLPFQQAMGKVRDYKTRKKYESIARRISVELEHSYLEALKVYGDTTPQGISILKKMLILYESMSDIKKAQSTRGLLRAMRVPGY